MKGAMTQAYIRTTNAAHRAKRGVIAFFTEEKGGAEIIAVVVLVAIVVALGVFFRDEIWKLVQGIFDGMGDPTFNGPPSGTP